MARFAYMYVVPLAIVAVLLAYVVRLPTHFVFTLSVTIPKADIGKVRQFISDPESIVSVHPNFFKVANMARDQDGRLMGTFSEYAKPLLFGAFRLPLPAIDIQFVLTTHGNKAYYEETIALGLTIAQTYIVVEEEGAVKVIDTFNCTCPWIQCGLIDVEGHAKEVHTQLLINVKEKFEK